MLKVKLIIRFNKDDRKEKRSLATSFIGGIVSYTHTHTQKFPGACAQEHHKKLW